MNESKFQRQYDRAGRRLAVTPREAFTMTRPLLKARGDEPQPVPDWCDYFACTAPIINGVPLCNHPQTGDAA